MDCRELPYYCHTSVETIGRHGMGFVMVVIEHFNKCLRSCDQMIQ
jgi:hypothetical protein